MGGSVSDGCLEQIGVAAAQAASMRFIFGVAGSLAPVTLALADTPLPGDAALAPYQPQSRVSGLIRNFGFGLGGVLELWERSFSKCHTGIRFEDHLPTSDAAIPALVTGVADLAPDDGEATLIETLSFFDTHGYPVTGITVATGAYDVEGRSSGIVVFVHKDNPISHLSIEQLDGIFGAERDAGMRGFEWTPSGARGAERNIRTWGQLGLTGEWTHTPIQIYGHAPSGTTRFFRWKALQNDDKWNPNFREYVEADSKMIAAEDRTTQCLGVKSMLANELSNDRYGIAWTVMPQAKGISGIKPIALSARAGGPYVMPSKRRIQDCGYPLTRNIYIFVNRPPCKSLDPRLRDFLRYALSREAQQIVTANGNHLPLTGKLAADQLKKLN
ncbi:MAG: phosphate ABC transporter substrate-binding protein [Gammaproteobacteria bacterium]|nr:phosphate ABC transporter substrate-binding protein [Gammaproteobacteria bacterium]